MAYSFMSTIKNKFIIPVIFDSRQELNGMLSKETKLKLKPKVRHVENIHNTSELLSMAINPILKKRSHHGAI